MIASTGLLSKRSRSKRLSVNIFEWLSRCVTCTVLIPGTAIRVGTVKSAPPFFSAPDFSLTFQVASPEAVETWQATVPNDNPGCTVANTLVLLIGLRVQLFSFSIIKKIETRDIYNGPHPNRASRDGITNLWDLQLAPPHFYFFSTTFVCSPIKIGRSEKQRAWCCSTFIPDHSLHSLFVFG